MFYEFIQFINFIQCRIKFNNDKTDKFLIKTIFHLVPGEPTNVRVSAVNSTTIHVSWKPPAEKDRNGIIRGYHIHVHEVKDEVEIQCLQTNMEI